MTNNQIKKQIELKAPISRVWRALTNQQEFEEWFRVKLDGPFLPGQKVVGRITNPEFAHIKIEISVQKIEPESFFSYTWHPYPVDPKVDYSNEEPTLVEFKLEKTADGTLLTVCESGFEKIPASRRLEAFRMNNEGWQMQMENIKNYVAGKH